MDAILRQVFALFEAPELPADAEAVLAVLADRWIEEGRAIGQELAQALRTDAHPLYCLLALGEREESWRGALESFIESACSEGDIETLAHWVEWTRFVAFGAPWQRRLAIQLRDLLSQVERRELAVIAREPNMTYVLENGWRLQVFVRGWQFWRIDQVVSPGGRALAIVEYPSGPLSEINEYEPPEDVESEVYGLGFSPRRSWSS
ncbi:MAG: hypothetical protein U0271_47345 [Polyangiaceae bacterium]